MQTLNLDAYPTETTFGFPEAQIISITNTGAYPITYNFDASVTSSGNVTLQPGQSSNDTRSCTTLHLLSNNGIQSLQVTMAPELSHQIGNWSKRMLELAVWVTDPQWGADPTGTIDSYTAIQNAINSLIGKGGIVYFPVGTYLISKPLVIPTTWSITLRGATKADTIIKKTTNTVGTGSSRLMRAGTQTDSYAVDSIISIDHLDNDYAYHQRIENLSLVGGAATNNAYAIYAPRTAHLKIGNVYTANSNIGFYTHDSWLMIIEEFHSYNCVSVLKYDNDGSNQSTGTSLTATRVWAQNAQVAYDIYGLGYSTFNSCAADHITTTSFNFNACAGLTLNSCGTEDVTGEVLKIYASKVTINSFRSYAINGVSTGTRAYLWFDSSNVVLNTCVFDNFVSALSSYNVIIQNGATVIANNTPFPTGGNTFISYSGGSLYHSIDSNGYRTRTNVDQERWGTIVDGRKIFDGTAAPTSGTWNQGDQIINSAPSASGYMGWVCVVAGTPGTWKGFGVIQA